MIKYPNLHRLGLVVLFAAIFCAYYGEAEASDWRWAPPKVKKERVTYSCGTLKCFDKVMSKERKKLKRKIKLHDARRLREWKKITKSFIPDCTWYGESGHGPEYSPVRYTMANSTGSGAYGKFQFMPGTYFTRAKYRDWSALDQEIAARREFRAHGTSPWSNCH